MVRICYRPWLYMILMICPFNKCYIVVHSASCNKARVCKEGNSFKAVLWWAWKAAKPVSLCSQHGSPRQPGVLQCPIISSLVSFSSHPLYRPLDSVYYHVPGSLSSLLIRARMDFCLSLIWKWRATCLQKWRMLEERRSSAWRKWNESLILSGRGQILHGYK